MADVRGDIWFVFVPLLNPPLEIRGGLVDGGVSYVGCGMANVGCWMSMLDVWNEGERDARHRIVEGYE
jgi:hypothetical protein